MLSSISSGTLGNSGGYQASSESFQERRRSTSEDRSGYPDSRKSVFRRSSCISGKEGKSESKNRVDAVEPGIRVARVDWTKRQEKCQEFCSTVKRPDQTQSVVHSSDRMIIRLGSYASHVLMIGKYFNYFDPFSCPYQNNGSGNEVDSTTSKECQNFRAVLSRNLKAHLEARHNLHNVQMNFVCPCPKEYNNGTECGWVEFDPPDMLLKGHIKDKHGKFYEKIMEEAACEKDCEKYIRTTFPSWTYDTQKLFPSQIFPDEIVVPMVLEGRRMHGVCNVGSCHNVPIPTCSDMDAHVIEVHGINILQTKLLHACPAEGCTVTQPAGSKQIGLHVQGMHQNLLGKSMHYSENAKKKRKELEEAAISTAKRVGEAISNSFQTQDEAAGIKPLFLSSYHCPVDKCNYSENNEDRVIWHIGAKHEDIWNVP